MSIISRQALYISPTLVKNKTRVEIYLENALLEKCGPKFLYFVLATHEEGPIQGVAPKYGHHILPPIEFASENLSHAQIQH